MVLLITGIPVLQLYSQPANLVLQDTTITGGASFVARNSITAGPNFTVTGTGDAILRTGGSIYFRPGVVVLLGGQLLTINDPTLLGVLTLAEPIPAKFSLHQNFPNPFNPSTTIGFDLPEAAIMTLKIYDVLGREIATLKDDEQFEPGTYTAEWNAAGIQTGVYFYRISAQTSEKATAVVKKLVLLR
jgi:hypothetical protein